MFSTIALGNIIKNGYAMATRWNLVWKYGDGTSHGLIGSAKDNAEEGVGAFEPRPPFFYLYYFQKFFGDKMISAQSDNDNIKAFASSFSDGNSGIILVNKTNSVQTTKITMSNFTAGQKYYWYTLTGGTDTDFSRKVYINGQNDETLNGPLNYNEIKANSCNSEGGILVDLPAYSSVFMLIEGNGTTGINNLFRNKKDELNLYPNPMSNNLNIQFELEEQLAVNIEIYDFTGRKIKEIYKGTKNKGTHLLSWNANSNTESGMYLLKMKINNSVYTEVISKK